MERPRATLGPLSAAAGDRPAGGVWLAGTIGVAWWDIARTARTGRCSVPGDLPGPVRDVAVAAPWVWVATDSGAVRLSARGGDRWRAGDRERAPVAGRRSGVRPHPQHLRAARAPPRYGLGDDCALLRADKATIALSIDLSVEGVHFRREWLSLPEIGYRAAVAALSDLAAEGARAGRPARVARPCRPIEPAGEAAEIMAGVGEAAALAGAKVLGGDLSRAPQIIVDVCAVGTAPRPVRRVGARAGRRRSG